MTDPQLSNPPKTIGTRLKRLLGLGLLLGVVLAAGLIVNAHLPKFRQQSRELEQNRATWESRQITHYRLSIFLPYEIANYDQLPMPLTAEVQDGKAVSVVDAEGQVVSQYDQNFLTMPGLFAYVDQSIREQPASLQVTYDPALGYPVSIYIDPYTEPCCQDFTISVRDFQILSP